jgi:hypothetical protein
MEKCVTKILPALTVTGFTNICRRIREHDTFHIVSRDKSPRRDPRLSPLSDPMRILCRLEAARSGHKQGRARMSTMALIVFGVAAQDRRERTEV